MSLRSSSDAIDPRHLFIYCTTLLLENETSNTTRDVIVTWPVRPIPPPQYHSNGRSRHVRRTEHRVRGEVGSNRRGASRPFLISKSPMEIAFVIATCPKPYDSRGIEQPSSLGLG